MQNVLDNTYRLIDEIKKDQRMIRLNELNNIINDKYEDELYQFDKAKADYNEALKYGKYHPSINDYERKLSETKAIVYKLPEVIEYNKLYRELQNEIDEMMERICTSVSDKFGGGHNGCKK